jgi:hypothetical protein
MDQIWDYDEIQSIIKSKKPELVKIGLYPFDKKGHRNRKISKENLLFKITVLRAKKFPPVIDKNGNMILPFFYNII